MRPELAGRYRALVVGHNRDVTQPLSMILCMLGHRAEAAFDARWAVEIGRTLKPQLVFVDLAMPSAAGRKVLADLRSLCTKAHYFALCGPLQAPSVAHLRAAGFHGKLDKPVRIMDLERTVVSLPSGCRRILRLPSHVHEATV